MKNASVKKLCEFFVYISNDEFDMDFLFAPNPFFHHLRNLSIRNQQNPRFSQTKSHEQCRIPEESHPPPHERPPSQSGRMLSDALSLLAQ